MKKFLIFLHFECVAIKALIDEFGESFVDEENMNMNLVSHIARYPELKEYYECDLQLEQEAVGEQVGVSELSQKNGIGDQESLQRQQRTRFLRQMIIEHLLTFDINISLLINVVEMYRLEAEIEELVEIVRAFDILGAEIRLKEYEVLLWLKITGFELKIYDYTYTTAAEENVMAADNLHGKRLPAIYWKHVTKFKFATSSKILGWIGSQRLIEYYLQKNDPINQLKQDELFLYLCQYGHLLTAQWLYTHLGTINYHHEYERPFRVASFHGQLLVIQWLYSLGNVDIHVLNDDPFRSACNFGHLLVAQWLHSLGDVNIYAANGEAFFAACRNGHLSILDWLYCVDHIKCHMTSNQQLFRLACMQGHLPIAQWLHNVSDVDIHRKNDEAFRLVCGRGHFSIVQWLYSLGGMTPALLQSCSTSDSIVQSWLQSMLEVQLQK
jgi:hypothetical protein